MLEGPVIGGFGILREGAGWELPHLQVIADAVAADAFPRAGRIGAVAVLHIAFLFTFHDLFLCNQRFDTIMPYNNTNYKE